MPFSRLAKMKLNNAAAALYMSEPNGAEATGMDWQELAEDDKDMWRAKAAGQTGAHQYASDEE